MKKLATISLFVFFCTVTAILTAGLVFYQNKKNTTSSVKTDNLMQTDISKLSSQGVKVLDMIEIAKHNKESDCWMLINGKIYDVTSYFGKHPGGSVAMLATCGKDATDAYKTKDPYAISSGSKTAHSRNAINLLDNFYIGDLNQKISAQALDQNIQKTNLSSNSIPSNYEGEEEYEDD